MAWTLLTSAQVLGELNNAEVEKYSDIVADSQADPLPGILTRTTDYVRGPQPNANSSSPFDYRGGSCFANTASTGKWSEAPARKTRAEQQCNSGE